AVLLAQVVEETRLVLLGEVVAHLLRGDARRGELLDERPRRHLELGRELFDRRLRHALNLLVTRARRPCQCAGATFAASAGSSNQCARAFMMSACARASSM